MKKIIMIVAFMAVCILTSSCNGDMSASESYFSEYTELPYIDFQNKYIYANGVSIEIEAGINEGTSKITYNNGKNTLDLDILADGIQGEDDLSKYTVYGGCENINAESSKVVINGGIIGSVCGGGNTGAVTGNTYVIINNGTVIGGVYGGGRTGAVNGCAFIEVNNGVILGTVYGGGFDKSSLVSETDVKITGGKICDVYGGAYLGTVAENTNINIRGGNICDVYGSGYLGKVLGNTFVKIDGEETTIWNVYGGGMKGESKVSGNTTVTVSGGNIGHRVCGGGYEGAVAGNTFVSVTGGSMDYVFGGGQRGEVIGDTTVAVLVGNIREMISGGGYAKSAKTGAANGIVSFDNIDTESFDNLIYKFGDIWTATSSS